MLPIPRGSPVLLRIHWVTHAFPQEMNFSCRLQSDQVSSVRCKRICWAREPAGWLASPAALAEEPQRKHKGRGLELNHGC